MSLETQELLHLFVSISSNDREIIQNASLKLTNLSTAPNYSLNLLSIIVNENIETIFRFSAGIQLKNLIDKNWQRAQIFSENDKQIIKNEILKCSILNRLKRDKFLNILAEIIAKISRFDWDKKWSNLFTDLFDNDCWFVIHRVCEAQVTRRLSAGVILFRETAATMSGEIWTKWADFLSDYRGEIADSGKESMIFNACYQLKTFRSFITHTHSLLSDDERFAEIVERVSRSICDSFPHFIEIYNNSVALSTNKVNYYKLLKSMIWVLLAFQHKCLNKFTLISNEIEQFGLKIAFNSIYLHKSDKLSLLIFNLMLNYVKASQKNRFKSSIFDVQIIDYIRIRYFICNDEEIENVTNDPEVILECKREKDSSIIVYNFDEVIEDLIVELVKGASNKNLNEVMETVLYPNSWYVS